MEPDRRTLKAIWHEINQKIDSDSQLHKTKLPVEVILSFYEDSFRKEESFLAKVLDRRQLIDPERRYMCQLGGLSFVRRKPTYSRQIPSDILHLKDLLKE